MDEALYFWTYVWPELYRAEGNKDDDTEAFGIEKAKHGQDFDTWPPDEREAGNWYYSRVWLGLQLNALPRSLAIDAFLFALNTSLVRSPQPGSKLTSPGLARALQCMLNGLGHPVEIDSVMGPVTWRALMRTQHTEKMAAAFRAAASMYYSGLSEFPKYKDSWLRRVRV